MTSIKTKRNLWITFLILLIIGQTALYLFLRYYQIPLNKFSLALRQKEINELQERIDQVYEKTKLRELITDYELKKENTLIFNQLRESVFIPSENDEEKYEFWPPLTEVIIPAITKHLHNSVKIEGISISEEGEVVIPIFASSYQELSKQYLSFKSTFEEEKDTLLKDIKLNTFLNQEVEILERNRQGRLVRNKRKVAKATIVAKLNPNYFLTEDNAFAMDEAFEFEGLGKKEKREGFIKKWSKVASIITANIKKDINYVFNKSSEEKENLSLPTPEEVEEKTDLETLGEEATEKEVTKEEVAEKKEIITKAIPTFYLNGLKWAKVPEKMSTFLAAGKTIVIEELSIDPYQNYTEEELIEQSKNMMLRLIEITPNKTVIFHKKDFNLENLGETVDLFEINQ